MAHAVTGPGGIVNPRAPRGGPPYGVEPMDISEPSPAVTPIELPPGRQFAVTWGIPERYGGMTAAMLRRSRAFVELAGTPVDVLTFDPQPDVDATRVRLRAQGELVDGMRLRNVFEDLRSDARPAVAVPVAPVRRSPSGGEETSGSGGVLRRWSDGDGRPVRIEHRRLDGSVALLDEQQRSTGPQRLLTSFDPSGAPTGQWTSASALYFEWLDRVRGDGRSFMIVDSKAVARLLQSYHRDDVVSLYRVHGSHRPRDGSPTLDASRRPVFENLHRWDSVVMLTERQRADVADLLGDIGNLAVAGNGSTPPAWIPRLPADPLHGVIVSRMTTLKRLDHALRVIAGVRAIGIPVTADIIGDGSQRAKLEALAHDLGLEGAVRFEGHVPSAAERFRTGAWTLITSRSEGSAMTIVEALGAGCIPLAYDIAYGPADVIEHGANGWLAPDGDIGAVTRLLAHQCALPEDEVAAMRRRARHTALRHDDRAAVTQWAEVQRTALRRHDACAAEAEVLDRVRVRRLRGRHLVTARVGPKAASADVVVRLAGPDGTVVRVPARRLGRLRSARLSRSDSKRLGDAAVRTLFLVSTAGEVIPVDAGTRHPDPRSLPRRALSRVRRLLERATAPAARPAAG